MTPQQIVLVRNSFARIAPIADHAAALFYDNLFLAQPQLRSLFRNGDMARKGEADADDRRGGEAARPPGALMPVLRKLGARHAGYDVKRGALRHGRHGADEDAGAGPGRCLRCTDPRGLGHDVRRGQPHDDRCSSASRHSPPEPTAFSARPARAPGRPGRPARTACPRRSSPSRAGTRSRRATACRR